MTPTIFSQPDTFEDEGRKYYMGPSEDGFSLEQLLQVAPEGSLKTCRPKLALQTSQESSGLEELDKQNA